MKKLIVLSMAMLLTLSLQAVVTNVYEVQTDPSLHPVLLFIVARLQARSAIPRPDPPVAPRNSATPLPEPGI
jgi:hypothetical protein